MKPMRFPAGCGRLRGTDQSEVIGGMRRSAVPARRSPVIQGLESEMDWQSHRDDVLRGLSPSGSAEEELAEEIARVLWEQRRVLRLTEHLRGVVARSPEGGSDLDVSRLRRLEALCTELDCRLVDAYRNLHAEQKISRSPRLTESRPEHVASPEQEPRAKPYPLRNEPASNRHRRTQPSARVSRFSRRQHQ